MNARKLARLSVTFYSYTAVPSILITAACCYICWQSGPGTVVWLFWIKLLSLALSSYFVKDYKNKEFYYYRNLGMSITKLWIITLGFDLLIFSLSHLLICITR